MIIIQGYCYFAWPAEKVLYRPTDGETDAAGQAPSLDPSTGVVSMDDAELQIKAQRFLIELEHATARMMAATSAKEAAVSRHRYAFEAWASFLSPPSDKPAPLLKQPKHLAKRFDSPGGK